MFTDCGEENASKQLLMVKFNECRRRKLKFIKWQFKQWGAKGLILFYVKKDLIHRVIQNDRTRNLCGQRQTRLLSPNQIVSEMKKNAKCHSTVVTQLLKSYRKYKVGLNHAPGV